MILTRYLAKEVYTTMLATLVVLLLIFLSNQFVRYLHYAAAGDISSHQVTLLLLLQLPILLAILLPLSLFVAILLAYGRLYADSEIVVLMACGVSPVKLLTTTLSFSAVVIGIVAILSLWINPKVYNYYDQILSGTTTSNLELLIPKRFNPIAKGKWIFYVGQASEDKKNLEKIFAAEEPDNNNFGKKALGIVIADKAHQIVDPETGDVYLILNNGYRYTGTPGQNDYQVIKYDEYGVRLPQKAEKWHPDASSSTTINLLRNYKDPLNAAELHWRLAMPLSALILTLLGTPLSRIKPKKGRYAQVWIAILLYILYANFLFLAKAWMKKGVLGPGIGMWWVHGMILLLALFYLWQQMGRQLKIKTEK